MEFNSFILYEGIRTTETNVIGHLIGDIGAHLEAGALKGILSLSVSHTHTHRKVVINPCDFLSISSICY